MNDLSVKCMHMEKIKIVFAGTGEFGVQTLNALAGDPRFEVSCVITGLDKPVGRKLEIQENAVKQAAILNKLFVLQSPQISSLKQKIIQINPDLLLVVAFGELLPSDILEIPRLGAINIHGSLLPKYRGASPIQESILNGDRITGITWIRMNKKMDQGDIVEQLNLNIKNTDTYEELSAKLAKLSADKTGGVLVNYVKSPTQTKQDDKLATYCRKIKKEDGMINFQLESADEIVRKIRAYTPWPSCYIAWGGKRLKIIKAEVSEQKIDTRKTETINGTKLLIGTKEKSLALLTVQPESKRAMSIEEFLRGQKNIPETL